MTRRMRLLVALFCCCVAVRILPRLPARTRCNTRGICFACAFSRCDGMLIVFACRLCRQRRLRLWMRFALFCASGFVCDLNAPLRIFSRTGLGARFADVAAVRVVQHHHYLHTHTRSFCLARFTVALYRTAHWACAHARVVFIVAVFVVLCLRQHALFCCAAYALFF